MKRAVSSKFVNKVKDRQIVMSLMTWFAQAIKRPIKLKIKILWWPVSYFSLHQIPVLTSTEWIFCLRVRDNYAKALKAGELFLPWILSSTSSMRRPTACTCCCCCAHAGIVSDDELWIIALLCLLLLPHDLGHALSWSKRKWLNGPKLANQPTHIG